MKIVPENKNEIYAVYDNHSKENNITKNIITPFKCNTPEKFKFHTRIFNNSKDMTKNTGSGWKLQFGWHRSPEEHKNPFKTNMKSRSFIQDHRLKDMDKSKNRHVIVSISEKLEDKPKHFIYLSHINTFDSSNAPYDNPKEYMMHIEFVSVHPDAQGKGLSKKTFYFLFSYLNKIKWKPQEIDLEYAASHYGIIKTYTEMMALFGYKNEIFDYVFNYENLIDIEQYILRLKALQKEKNDMSFYIEGKKEIKQMCKQINNTNKKLAELRNKKRDNAMNQTELNNIFFKELKLSQEMQDFTDIIWWHRQFKNLSEKITNKNSTETKNIDSINKLLISLDDSLKNVLISGKIKPLYDKARVITLFTHQNKKGLINNSTNDAKIKIFKKDLEEFKNILKNAQKKYPTFNFDSFIKNAIKAVALIEKYEKKPKNKPKRQPSNIDDVYEKYMRTRQN